MTRQILLILATCATLAPRLHAQVTSMPHDLVTSTVEVDNLAMRVRTSQLQNRDPRIPVIVFESGGGVPLETWDPILSRVAAFAPVVAYDRAGTGHSAWDNLPPTPQRVAARLGRLLEALNAAPPFVLVGHSWGGTLIRYFAGSVPEGVVGMVFLDPTDFTQSPADELSLFESIGAGATGRAAFYDLMERGLTAAPPPLRAEGQATLAFFRQPVAGRDLPRPLDVPTTVILAGRQPRLPQSIVPFDVERYAVAMQQQRVARLQHWVRAGGEFLVLDTASHMVHADAPDVVVTAIRRLVTSR